LTSSRRSRHLAITVSRSILTGHYLRGLKEFPVATASSILIHSSRLQWTRGSTCWLVQDHASTKSGSSFSLTILTQARHQRRSEWRRNSWLVTTCPVQLTVRTVHLPSASNWKTSNPMTGISGAGIAFYSSSFDLALPAGHDLCLPIRR